MRSFILILLGLTALPSCAKAPPPTSPEPAASPTLSAAQCEAGGGTVVGDIGDGAIHQPGYRCPDSGELPLGSIVAEPNGPMGVEGAVCCA